MQTLSDAVELTRALIRVNTVNPPGNENACAVLLGDLLQRAGFDIAYREFDSDRTSLVASIGAPGNKPKLAITGHLDTVPLGFTRWSIDPFSGEIANGRIYGRGASDMKSGVAAFVTAAVRQARLLRGSAGLILIITAGEETGCQGASSLVAGHALRHKIGSLVVAEPTSNYPLVGHKGALWLHARVRGVAAHGSMPERGENAIYKAARAVCRLEQYQIDQSHPFFGRTTLNVGTIKGGTNINSVPDSASIGIDIRTVPGVDHAGMREELGNALSGDVELQSILDLPGVYTDPSHPWIRAVFALLEEIRGVPIEPRGISYFTDASVFYSKLGLPPTVILGPGDPAVAHQTDEYCELSRIDEAVDIYERLIERWCER